MRRSELRAVIIDQFITGDDDLTISSIQSKCEFFIFFVEYIFWGIIVDISY